MTNTDLVKQAYSNFATGNVAGVLASFDPAIEWHECKGMPIERSNLIKGTLREKFNSTYKEILQEFEYSLNLKSKTLEIK